MLFTVVCLKLGQNWTNKVSVFLILVCHDSCHEFSLSCIITCLYPGSFRVLFPQVTENLNKSRSTNRGLLHLTQAILEIDGYRIDSVTQWRLSRTQPLWYFFCLSMSEVTEWQQNLQASCSQWQYPKVGREGQALFLFVSLSGTNISTRNLSDHLFFYQFSQVWVALPCLTVRNDGEENNEHFQTLQWKAGSRGKWLLAPSPPHVDTV